MGRGKDAAMSASLVAVPVVTGAAEHITSLVTTAPAKPESRFKPSKPAFRVQLHSALRLPLEQKVVTDSTTVATSSSSLYYSDETGVADSIINPVTTVPAKPDSHVRFSKQTFREQLHAS
jgi:hypothetical protein